MRKELVQLYANRINEHVKKLVNKALKLSLASAKLKGEQPNLVLLSATINSQVQTEVDYCISLIREVLVDLCIDRHLASEFVAIVRLNSSYKDAGMAGRVWYALHGKHEMDGLHKLLVSLTGEVIVTSETDIQNRICDIRGRVANNLDRIICYPDSFVEITNNEGSTFRITRQYSIGRSKQKDTYVIPAKSVSAQHAVISVDRNGTWYLADHASRYGTKLNGTLVTSVTPLHQGDVITIADEFDLVVSRIDSMESLLTQALVEEQVPSTPSAPQTDKRDEASIPTTVIGNESLPDTLHMPNRDNQKQ